MGLAAPSQEPHLSSRLCGPRTSALWADVFFASVETRSSADVDKPARRV